MSLRFAWFGNQPDNQGFFDRRHGIETMQLKQVNVTGAQTFQGAFDGANQMKLAT